MGHKASTICLHLDLSCAACCASPQVRFMSFSSAVTVRRQVFLDFTHERVKLQDACGGAERGITRLVLTNKTFTGGRTDCQS